MLVLRTSAPLVHPCLRFWSRAIQNEPRLRVFVSECTVYSHPRPSFKWLAILHVLQFWNIDWNSVVRFGADPFLLRDIIYAITSFINTDYEYQQVRFLSCATGSSHSLDACIDNLMYALCFYVYIDNSLHVSRYRCMHRSLDACIEVSRCSLMSRYKRALEYTAYALVLCHESVHDALMHFSDASNSDDQSHDASLHASDASMHDASMHASGASVPWCIDACHASDASVPRCIMHPMHRCMILSTSDKGSLFHWKHFNECRNSNKLVEVEM